MNQWLMVLNLKKIYPAIMDEWTHSYIPRFRFGSEGKNRNGGLNDDRNPVKMAKNDMQHFYHECLIVTCHCFSKISKICQIYVGTPLKYAKCPMLHSAYIGRLKLCLIPPSHLRPNQPECPQM